MSGWYAKVDSGIHANRKIRRAGNLGRQVYVFALCVNASRRSNGTLPASDFETWYLADQLMVSEADAARGLTSAIDARLLEVDGDQVHIVGWEAQWGRTSASNAERQARYRQRHNHNDLDNSNVTSNDTPLREVTPSNAVTQGGRKEGREEARNARDSLSRDSDSVRSGRRESAQDAAQPLPDGWEPSPEATRLAQGLGLDTRHEAQQFRLHSRAKGRTYVDADAAFEKWLRGSRDKGRTKGSKPGSTTPKPARTRVRLENGTLLEEDANGELVPVKQDDGPKAGD